MRAFIPNVMVKSLPPLKHAGALWRDGRAAEGACLENMFGSHQRGFESHSLRHNIDGFGLTIYDKLKSQIQNR